VRRRRPMEDRGPAGRDAARRAGDGWLPRARAELPAAIAFIRGHRARRAPTLIRSGRSADSSTSAVRLTMANTLTGSPEPWPRPPRAERSASTTRVRFRAHPPAAGRPDRGLAPGGAVLPEESAEGIVLLENKVAIVSGIGPGMGRDVSPLAREGADIVRRRGPPRSGGRGRCARLGRRAPARATIVTRRLPPPRRGGAPSSVASTCWSTAFQGL
jgi:hypothetical protein